VDSIVDDPGWAITGSISGTTLTVTTTSPYHTIAVNDPIGAGAGITLGTYITALGTGAGQTGTYTVNNSQTVGSESMKDYSQKSGFDLTGTGSGGCGLNGTNVSIFDGLQSVLVDPPNGGVVYAFFVNSFFDNGGKYAFNIVPTGTGAIDYLKVQNSEMSPYQNGGTDVEINGAAGSIGYLDFSHNSIYAYSGTTGTGIYTTGTAPLGLVIEGNDIGLQAGGHIAAAISLNTGSSATQNVTIIGNNLKGSTNAVYLQNANDKTCVMSNNITSGSVSSCSGGGALSVWSCTIPDTAGTGVYFCPWKAANTSPVPTYFDDFSITYNSTCSTTYPIVSIYDITASTALGSTTVPNSTTTTTSVNGSASGAVAGDQYGFRVTTAGSGCSATLATEFIYLTASMRN
jgi:hypothetical protein